MSTQIKENLPSVRGVDGFDDVDTGESVDVNRVIQGVILKCVDGRWSDRDGLDPPKNPLLGLNTASILQRWKKQQPIETIVKQIGLPLPSADELNAEIPREEWELGLDGQPRPPWQRQLVVHLLDEQTCDKYTFASGTIGARVAVDRLRDSVSWMRKIKGIVVYPLVALERLPMKTKFGTKMRPDFRIVGWRGFDDSGPSVPQLEEKRGIKTVDESSLSEQLDDIIQY